jgi:hypothetical protein
MKGWVGGVRRRERRGVLATPALEKKKQRRSVVKKPNGTNGPFGLTSARSSRGARASASEALIGDVPARSWR